MKKWFKITCGGIFLFQICLLIWVLINYRGRILSAVNVTFLRIAMLLGSAIMVILTRYFLKLIDYIILRGGKTLITILQIIYILPAFIIPLGGFYLAKFAGSYKEYLLFFVIGLYHLVRYYKPVERLGGLVS